MFQTNEKILCIPNKKAKADYYENLDLGNITHSRIFWNKVKALLSGDVENKNSIILDFALK